MQLVMQSSKVCANCAYWCGKRKKDGFFGRMELDSFSEKGECQNVRGYYRQMCNWNTSCGSFVKHPVVK